MARKTLVTGSALSLGGSFWLEETGAETVRITPTIEDIPPKIISRSEDPDFWFHLTSIMRGDMIPSNPDKVRVFHMEDI